MPPPELFSPKLQLRMLGIAGWGILALEMACKPQQPDESAVVALASAPAAQPLPSPRATASSIPSSGSPQMSPRDSGATACDDVYGAGDASSLPRIERAARLAYVDWVLRKKLDVRDFAHHPLVVSTVARVSGELASRCIDEWGGDCPDCVIHSGKFAPEGAYVLVRLSFNDAADGEYDYFVFIDGATRQVGAVTRQVNFRP